jgi:hypothetical protein
MNRRLIYSILIIIILVLLINYTNGVSGIVSKLNLVVILCFTSLLIYQYIKFRRIDKVLHDASMQHGVPLYYLATPIDDIQFEERDW